MNTASSTTGNRSLYDNLLSSMKEGVVFQNSEGKILLANKSAEKMLGLSLDQLMGRKSIDPRWKAIREDGTIFPGEDHPAMVTLRTHEALENVIMGIRKPDNSLTWISINSHPLNNNSGDRPDSVFTVFEDITEKQRLKERALSSERQLEDILWKNDAGYLEYDRAGNIESNNSVLQNIFDNAGINIGTNLFSLLEKLGESVPADLNKTGHLVPSEFDATLSDKNNTNVHLRCQLLPVFSSSNKITGGVMLVHNNTAVKNLEQEFNRLRENYSLIAENTVDVAWMMTPDLNFKYVSPSVRETFGYSQEEFLNLSINDILTSSSYPVIMNAHSKRLNMEKRGIREHFVIRVELEHVRKSGERFWAEVVSVPVRDGSGKLIGIAGRTTDISNRIEAEDRTKSYLQELELNRKMLEDKTERLAEINEKLKISEKQQNNINKFKDKLFSVIAHDLKNPISSILGLSDLIINEMKMMKPDTIRDYMLFMKDSALKLHMLVDNLFSWAKSQSEGMNIKPVNTNIKELVTSSIQLIRNSAHEKNLDINVDIQDNLTALVDEECISLVVRNLMSNAVKFTRNYGKIDLHADMDDEHLTISVKDNGMGMDENIMQKLFKDMNSFSTAGTNNEKGTGLGLKLSRTFVEAHGGEISVESEKGKGSEFKIFIPVC